MLENKFQAHLIARIKTCLPGCFVMKNDPNYIQGLPDLTILYGNRWAMLECKRGEHEACQPNQHYYISLMDSMSFASFICPENEELVLGLMFDYLTQ